jgi:hypothetical protein
MVCLDAMWKMTHEDEIDSISMAALVSFCTCNLPVINLFLDAKLECVTRLVPRVCVSRLSVTVRPTFRCVMFPKFTQNM